MANAPGICIMCKDQMDDPRILPCFHSFCLKCLESSSNNEFPPKCPDCEAAFEMPGGSGLKYLMKKNEFGECLNDFMRNLNMCDCPREKRVSTFCIDCEFEFCSFCQGRHHENHNQMCNTVSGEVDNFTKYRNCKDQPDVMDVFCEECGIMTHDHSLSLKHKNHKLIPISKCIKCIQTKFKESIRQSKDILENILINYGASSEAMERNEMQALNLKNRVQQRMDMVKRAADGLGDKYKQKIDADLKKHQTEANDILKKLKNMETSLKSHIVTMENQLNQLSYDSIMEAISHKPSSNVLTDIPIYSENIEMFFEKQDYFCDLSVAIGKLKSESTFKLINQRRFGFKIESLTTNQDDIYVSHGTKISAYKCDGMILRTSYDCKDLLRNISNLVEFKNMLFVSGSKGGSSLKRHISKNKTYDCSNYFLKIIRFDEPFQGVKREIFKCPFNENSSLSLSCNLSKTDCGNLFLNRGREIKILETNGRVVKDVRLSFEPENVVCLNRQRFLVSHVEDKRYFSVVDDEGNVLSRRETGVSFVKHLFVDEFELVYLHTYEGSSRLTVLDNRLDYAYSFGMKRVFSEICHDEVRKNLLVVSVLFRGGGVSSILSTYQL